MVTNTYHFVYKSVCDECGKMLEEERERRARTEIKVNLRWLKHDIPIKVITNNYYLFKEGQSKKYSISMDSDYSSLR